MAREFYELGEAGEELFAREQRATPGQAGTAIVASAPVCARLLNVHWLLRRRSRLLVVALLIRRRIRLLVSSLISLLVSRVGAALVLLIS